MGRALDKYLISKKAKESASLSAPVERKKWTDLDIKDILDRAGHNIDWESAKVAVEPSVECVEQPSEKSDKPVEVSDEVGSW